MKTATACALAMMLGVSTGFAGPLDDVYHLGPDSEPHPGVPQGKVIGPTALLSKVYPNTTRDYWIYVPAQYDPSKPACLMVFFDGHAYVGLKGSYRIPYVFDNLIYRREMPVTIGVFINPGHGPDQKEASDAQWGDGTTNRRVEYNALDDTYSKLVVDELLPVVTKQYNISPDPEDRAISGASSGAICAFTVAWHRPDQFRKVISTIGSFTNIMGGHVYPDLIRKSEPKPIRIFLQDGLNDNRGVRRGGDLRPEVGLARAEHQDGRGADREGVRRQLHLGDRHALQQARRRDHARDAPLDLARPSQERRPQRSRRTHPFGPGRSSEGRLPTNRVVDDPPTARSVELDEAAQKLKRAAPCGRAFANGIINMSAAEQGAPRARRPLPFVQCFCFRT